MKKAVSSQQQSRRFVPDTALRSWLNTRQSARVRCSLYIEVAWEPIAATLTASSFTKVQARDLSQRGLSFYSDFAPRERPILLKLGTARQPMFVLARVVRCERDFDDPQRRFIVGCQFVQRLQHG